MHMRYDPAHLRSAAQVGSALAAIPELGLVAAMLRTHGLRPHLYGGAVRDLLAFGEVGGDLDVVPVAPGTWNIAEFEELITSFAQAQGWEVSVFRGFHFALENPASEMTIDVLYPCGDIRDKLARTEFSWHAIGYDLERNELIDPYGGIADLRTGLLRIHSPEFFIANPPHYSRVFRIASLLGVPVPDAVLEVVRRYGHLISIHDGTTNIPAMQHVLKLLSIPYAERYVRQFIEAHLLSYLIPELTPLDYVHAGSESVTARNIRRAEMLDAGRFPAEWDTFLDTPLTSAGTVRGFLRLALLFDGLGTVYAELGGASPYSERIGAGDAVTLARRHFETLIGHVAGRYRDAPDLSLSLIAIAPMLAESDRILSGDRAFDGRTVALRKRALILSAVRAEQPFELPPMSSIISA
jgi:hypothetical protein